MIKDNQILFNRIRVVLDGIIVILSYLLAWYLKFETPFGRTNDSIGVLPANVYFSTLYILVPGYMILYQLFNLNASRRSIKIRYDIGSILEANIVGIILIMVSLFLLKMQDFSRGMLFAFFVINTLFTILSRIAFREFLFYIRKKGYNLKHILLVGYSRSAEGFISRVEYSPQWGYAISGILDNEVPKGTTYHGVEVIGQIDDLERLLEENDYDEITISLSLKHYELLEDLVEICEKSGIPTKFIPDYTGLFPSNPYTEDILGLPVISIRYVPLRGLLNRFIKRLVDIIGALVALIIFSPIMLIAAIAIKITSPGPVIFKQERVGLGGKHFMMYKLRTMDLQEDKKEKKAWTIKDDPRVTRVGRILRKTSIDEMPQFYNILIGDMSLIGPRPERPTFVEKFKEEIPRYMVKHQVRPGLTGWAQINGYRGDTSIRKRIEYDLYYIENWSLFFDIKILLGTFLHGFVNKNAY